jgi:5'-3' exonuclease
MTRLREVFLDTSGMTLEQLTDWGEEMCRQQRAVNWAIGDVARHARHVLRLGDNMSQVFPPWVSYGLIQRCEAVASAYPKEEDRNPLATWTIHAQHANKPNRIELVAASVEAGRTSDEERRHAVERSTGNDSADRWIAAFDVSGKVNEEWHAGNEIDAAMRSANWISRTIERLKAKGLTDALCCFDSPINHRKELTKDWEHKYKGNRGPKDPRLVQQLGLCESLLRGKGFACVSMEGMEADDLLASVASQFNGKVTIVSGDKDMRQCLSERCNILLDVEWKEDEHTGESKAVDKWLTAKQHTEDKKIPPELWTQFQAICGDLTDNIKGAPGIGEKGATDLVTLFGTARAAIEAAKKGEVRIKPKQQDALLKFEDQLDVTLKLVTLRTDLDLPTTTRLS